MGAVFFHYVKSALLRQQDLKMSFEEGGEQTINFWATNYASTKYQKNVFFEDFLLFGESTGRISRMFAFVY